MLEIKTGKKHIEFVEINRPTVWNHSARNLTTEIASSKDFNLQKLIFNSVAS